MTAGSVRRHLNKVDRLVQNGHETDGRTDPANSSSAIGAALGGLAQKALGAYYTDAQIAEFLVRWAVVTPGDTVMDPGFGGGAFLFAAIDRIRELGGDPRRQVFGIELDELPFYSFASKPAAGTPVARLLRASFFDVSASDLPPVDAVVGNPPFVRYQRFSGAAREAALRRAREAGVELSGLASAWAPFLVHAATFVKAGGRLAVVAPAELTHAAYAKPVLEHLLRTFRSIRILSFSRRMFPSLSLRGHYSCSRGWPRPGMRQLRACRSTRRFVSPIHSRA